MCVYMYPYPCGCALSCDEGSGEPGGGFCKESWNRMIHVHVVILCMCYPCVTGIVKFSGGDDYLNSYPYLL